MLWLMVADSGKWMVWATCCHQSTSQPRALPWPPLAKEFVAWARDPPAQAHALQFLPPADGPVSLLGSAELLAGTANF